MLDMYKGLVNSPETTITNNINTADTIIYVLDPARVPDQLPNLMTLGTGTNAETVKVLSIDGNALTVQRGFQGVAKDWLTGTIIARNFTEYDHNAFKENIETLDGGKVDKIAGKGLSTEDYTTAEKTKLEGIATGANKIIVNNTLTSTSTTEALSANQGKVLKDSLDAHLADDVQPDNADVTRNKHVSNADAKSWYDHINASAPHADHLKKSGDDVTGVFTIRAIENLIIGGLGGTGGYSVRYLSTGNGASNFTKLILHLEPSGVHIIEIEGFGGNTIGNGNIYESFKVICLINKQNALTITNVTGNPPDGLTFTLSNLDDYREGYYTLLCNIDATKITYSNFILRVSAFSRSWTQHWA